MPQLAQVKLGTVQNAANVFKCRLRSRFLQDKLRSDCPLLLP